MVAMGTAGDEELTRWMTPAEWMYWEEGEEKDTWPEGETELTSNANWTGSYMYM